MRKLEMSLLIDVKASDQDKNPCLDVSRQLQMADSKLRLFEKIICVN